MLQGKVHKPAQHGQALREQKVQVVVDGGEDDDDTEARAAYLLPDSNPGVCGPAAV